MSQTEKYPGSRKCRKGIFLFLCILLFAGKTYSQCPVFTSPGLFGLSGTSIYCRNQPITIGVYNSVGSQSYYFSVYRNGVEFKKKGGPLTGNGNTLSVGAAMRSAQDAGEYRITTYDTCGHSGSTSYFAYYGAIDNLSLVSWGNNNVKFNWAASSPVPVTANDYVTYNYVVTTRSNPNLVPEDSISSTKDTFALVSSGLVNGTTYYIHVRVDRDSIFKDGNQVEDRFNCLPDFDTPLPWRTIRFVNCSAAATVGTITPVNPGVCPSNTVALTATSGFTTYAWYDSNNVVIPGANASVYNAPSAGQYKIYVTKSGSTCQGMIASATVNPVSTQTGRFSGAGDFYAGDTVKLAIDSTVNGQTYKILKDGVEVFSTAGIGFPEQSFSPSAIWYNFVITSSAQAGLYTVRVTSPNCGSADFGSAQVNLITGVTICPNSNTSFTFSSPGNNTSFQWQVDPGAGFTNITNNATYGGAATKTLTITNAAATMYGYKYRCNASGVSPVTSSTRTLKFGVTWVGGTAGNLTNWATAANWSCNTAPNTNLDVIIPVTANQPVIGANVTCHSVLVKPGATLKVNTGFKLTISGQ